MKIVYCIGLIVFSNLCALAQSKVTKIDDLNGMAGCWEQKDVAKKLLISEMWMSPAGGTMLGMGRTVKNGKTTGWEYMRIEQRADGIYFVSKPKENSEDTSFKIIRSTVEGIVFENKDHDFPQRVIYKLNGATMTGRIEGNNSGEFMFFDFPMTRVKCN